MTIETWQARVRAVPGADDRIRAIETEFRRAVANARAAVDQGRDD